MATFCVYVNKDLRQRMRQVHGINWAQLIRHAIEQELTAQESKKQCCSCGTTENLHKDGKYGYRCDSEGCIPF